MLMHRAYFVLTNVKNCRALHLGQPLPDQKFKFDQVETRPEKRLKIEDKVPQSFRLVYRAPMKNYVLMNQILSSSSMVMAGGIAAFKLADLVALGLPLSNLLESNNFTPLEVGVTYTLTTLFIASLVTICQRFPLRMYKCDNTSRYLYVKYGFLPLATNKFEVKPGDILVNSAHDEMKGLKNCYDKANKSKLILFPSFFRSPSDFLELIGHYSKDKSAD